MKLLVLDMDGVVNSDELIEKWIKDKFNELENDNNCYLGDELRLAVRKSFEETFCHSTELVFPELAEKISKIIQKTGAKILWSSSWRTLEKYEDMEVAKEMFNRRGLPGNALIGYTPTVGMYYSSNNCRGSEIKLWINNNTIGAVEKAAVVDDRSDAGWDLPDCARFFPINPYIGITDHDVKKIINYLNDKEKDDVPKNQRKVQRDKKQNSKRVQENGRTGKKKGNSKIQ